jgi:hypothetical protein
MKNKILLGSFITFLMFASILNVLAAPPLPPCIFYGYVHVGGRPARDGLTVTAVIRGTTLKWTTETMNGTYGWPDKGSGLPDGFWIPSDDPSISGRDGGITGDIIEFSVGEIQLTGQTATFESGGAIRHDLSVPSAASNQSSIAVAVDCLATYVGFKVKISGRLMDANGLGISGASLLATYATGGGSPKDIASFNTTVDGNYYAEWMPLASGGNYSINVSWEGNEDFTRAEASINLAFTPQEEKYVFSVISDSAVSELAFNSTNKILGFTLEGTSGTTGFANVTIAEDLIAEKAGLKVYLDGNQTDYTATSSDAAWLLHFTYQHSTHNVTINLSQSATPFFETPLGIATIVGIVVVVVLGVTVGFYKKGYRLKKYANTPSRTRNRNSHRDGNYIRRSHAQTIARSANNRKTRTELSSSLRSEY